MSGELSPHEWHNRYLQQAQWTRDLRRYLYSRVSLETSQHILDIGCGTGVLEVELEGLCCATLFGLDINSTSLELAMRNTQRTSFTQGDAHQIPYPSHSFDISMCHFLLLWVANPLCVVAEMARVTRPGGAVLALAEPDYGGRIDHPAGLAALGPRQSESLRLQGADPLMGRKLAGIFHQAGLQDIESGVLGGQWSGNPTEEAWNIEWQVLENDLDRPGVETPDLQVLKELDWAAWQRGDRVLYVPTFYALGVNPA